jgi:hypothetical protein
MSVRKNGWTEEEGEQLKSALTNSVSVQRLAVRLNRTESSIKSRASALGLTLPAVKRLRETAAPTRWVARKRNRSE